MSDTYLQEDLRQSAQRWVDSAGGPGAIEEARKAYETWRDTGGGTALPLPIVGEYWWGYGHPKTDDSRAVTWKKNGIRCMERIIDWKIECDEVPIYKLRERGVLC